MLDMQHLVKKDVFDKPLGHLFRIKSLADSYAVVDVIMMTQDATRTALRPCHRGFADAAAKKLPIQFSEHAIEIVDFTLCRRDLLSPSTTSCQVGSSHDGRRK